MKNQEKGQEINADFKNNQNNSPNSDQELEKDLVDPEDYPETDGQIVKSSEPDSQEWGAREESNQKH